MSILELDLHNRRRAIRFNRTIHVNATYPGFRRSRSVALNVSATGARLVLSKATRERFLLELDAHTQVVARPVWSRSLGRSTVTGVSFEFRSDRERRQLVRFLQRQELTACS